MPGKIKWTDELRVGLLALYEEENLSPDNRCTIFNEVFEGHLRSCLGGELLKKKDHGKLSSQYHERSWASRWTAAMQAPASAEALAERTRIQEQVAQIAARLRAQSAVTTPRTSSHLRRAQRATPSRSQALPTPPASLGSAPSTPRARTSSRRKVPSKRSLPDDLFTPTSGVRKTKRRILSRTALSVEVTVQAAEPSTPSQDTADSLVPYERHYGPILPLTPEKYARTQEPSTPVSAALAAPQKLGLFYRYFDEDSAGLNSERGFRAGRFILNNMSLPQAPISTKVEFTDVESHLEGHRNGSPFISVSECLVWVLRLALKRAKKGAISGRIAFIDADAVESYHMHPYHLEIKKKKAFLKGKWCYGGRHEYIVWAQIPRSAILKILDVGRLIEFIASKPALSTAMSLETIAENGALKTKLLPRLEAKSKGLSDELIGSIASLARFVGASDHSCAKHIEHLISDIVQGWCVRIDPKAPAEWAEVADIFAHNLAGSERHSCFKVKMAFLAGVCAGMGDWNMLHDPGKIRQMIRRAKAVGLADPKTILLDSLEDARREIIEYDVNRTERLQGGASIARIEGVGARHAQQGLLTPPTAATTPTAAEEDDEIVFDQDSGDSEWEG